MRRPALFIGTEGWDYDAWSGAFYPEDLPVDWRLTYYANEYGVVLVPRRLWSGASASELESWASDVPTGFRFFLRVSADGLDRGATVGRLSASVEALGVRCAGVVADAPTIEPEAGERLAVPIYFPRRTPEEDGLLYLADPSRCADGFDRVMLWATDRLPDLPRRRDALERLVSGCRPGRDAALFITGTPPDLDGVEETLTLAQLLGVA